MSDYLNDTKNDVAKAREEALQAVAEALSPERRHAIERIARMNARYIEVERDKELRIYLEEMIDSIYSEFDGDCDKRRIVGVCGESGAGKSTAVLHHLKQLDALRPRRLADGTVIDPVMVHQAPSPCTPRQFAISGLENLGFPVDPFVQEGEAMRLFREQLQVNRKMVVFIDEAQHTIDTADRKAIKKMANAFKQIVQDEWPVRLVLAGVEPLAHFLSNDSQIYNRRRVLPFSKVNVRKAAASLKKILMIVSEDAGLEAPGELGADFFGRLGHACSKEFGSMIQFIRAAAEVAIRKNDPRLELAHFIKVYRTFSGCLPEENVFKAEDWKKLVPARALFRAADFAWEAAQQAKKAKNANARKSANAHGDAT